MLKGELFWRQTARLAAVELLANEPLLIGGALLAVCIVLGVLYESYVHPEEGLPEPGE